MICSIHSEVIIDKYMQFIYLRFKKNPFLAFYQGALLELSGMQALLNFACLLFLLEVQWPVPQQNEFVQDLFKVVEANLFTKSSELV